MTNKTVEWSNWAGNVKATPTYYHQPKSIQDIQDIVDSCRIREVPLRVTGAAHSFSPIAQPEDDTLSLQNFRGLISYDEELMEARVWAGTYLHEAVSILGKIGMAFENLGDIQEQSIAGAICTGTHGTGINLGSLSNQIIAWTWVDGTGKVNHHRRADDDLSKALSLSLGLMGIIIDVTIKTVPLYSLKVVSARQSFNDALEAWSTDIINYRHIEWFYFPGTDIVQVKKSSIIPFIKQGKKSKTSEYINDNVVETLAFKLISEACAFKPRLTREMTKFSAKNVPLGTKKGMYYEVLASKRKVRFTETEYAIPLNQFEIVIKEIHQFLMAHPFYVHFPIECRVTAGEDSFLSPTQGERTAYIAFHMYNRIDEGPYFKWVHNLMARYGGRPHFGKMNELTYEKMHEIYPNVEKFMAIRKKYDPNQVFMGPYFQALFMNN